MRTLIPLLLIAVVLAEHDTKGRNEATRPENPPHWGNQSSTTDTVPLYIECEDSYALGERIRIRVGGGVPEEMDLKEAWEIPDVFQSERIGEYIYLWTTVPGEYPLKLTPEFTTEVLKAGPNWPDDPKDMRKVTLAFTGQSLTRTILVGLPAPDPQPDPQPDAPLSALAKLVPNPETRRALFEFFGDLAESVESITQPLTVQHFIDGYRKSVADAKKAGLLPSDGSITPIDAPISERIKATLGPVSPEAVLVAEKKAALVAVLREISKEFER